MAQVGNTFKTVGAVAPSTARHFHLGQHTTATLEDGDPHLGHEFLQVDGQKETGGTATDDGCSHICRYYIYSFYLLILTRVDPVVDGRPVVTCTTTTPAVAKGISMV